MKKARFLGITLREEFKNWEDFDVVARRLGQYIGIFEEGEHASDYKAFFWSANPVGEILHDMLLKLVEMGALEFNDEEIQFRWNKNFDAEKTYSIYSYKLVAASNKRKKEKDDSTTESV